MVVLVEAICDYPSQCYCWRFVGGWNAFQHNIPNGTFCKDDDLVRVGFMTPNDTRAYVSGLNQWLIFQRATKLLIWQSLTKLAGLQFLHLASSAQSVQRNENQGMLACRHDIEGVGFPAGWKYEKSTSQDRGCDRRISEERLIFLRIEMEQSIS